MFLYYKYRLKAFRLDAPFVPMKNHHNIPINIPVGITVWSTGWGPHYTVWLFILPRCHCSSFSCRNSRLYVCIALFYSSSLDYYSSFRGVNAWKSWCFGTFLTCASSCGGRGDRTGRTPVHTGDTGTAGGRCASGSDV